MAFHKFIHLKTEKMQNNLTLLQILRGRKPSKYVKTIVLEAIVFEAEKPKHAKN